MSSLLPWLVAHGYPLLFLTLLVSGIGVPIPEDIPLIAAGVMADHGGMSVPAASLVCGGFVLLRDFLVYSLGRRHGHALLKRRHVARFLRPELVAKVEGRIQRHGILVVAGGRLMAGARVVVFFAAGVAGVDRGRFLLTDGLMVTLTVPLFVLLGFYSSQNLDRILGILANVRGVSVALVVVLVLGFFLRRHLKRRAEERA